MDNRPPYRQALLSLLVAFPALLLGYGVFVRAKPLRLSNLLMLAGCLMISTSQLVPERNKFGWILSGAALGMWAAGLISIYYPR